MWTKEDEIEFFLSSIKNNIDIQNLFYKIKDSYFAYIPKNNENNIATLQSRNAIIGSWTEKWCKDLLEEIAKQNSLYAINGVICEELGLNKQSSADLAFCTTNDKYQNPDNIKVIFEIKMSIVNNYKYESNNREPIVQYYGDYKSHKGMPSLRRSDSVLKAIGKAINIRVSSEKANSIPIIILGNTNVSENYLNKIDHLGKYGIIQKVISLNPSINENNCSKDKFFITPNDENELSSILNDILKMDLHYFSTMIDMEKLAKIIKDSVVYDDNEKIVKYFLDNIKGV